MKTKIVSLLLFVFLVACVAVPPVTPAIVATNVSVLPIYTSTQEDTSFLVDPTSTPTQIMVSVITPDLTQLEHWKEYQIALAESLFFPPEETLCEWDILGTSEQTLYIWVVCESIFPFGTTNAGKDMYSSSSTPALIHLIKDGTIQSVEIPAPGISDYARLFPIEIQNKFEFYRFGRAKELSDHIQRRREHPNELPLIILSVTPIP